MSLTTTSISLPNIGRSLLYPTAISLEETAQEPPGLEQVVVYLYEPDSSTTYVDQCGAQALFSFDLDEVELDKAIQAPKLPAVIQIPLGS